MDTTSHFNALGVVMTPHSMAIDRINKKMEGQKFENGTLSGQNISEMRPKMDKSFEKWELKHVAPVLSPSLTGDPLGSLLGIFPTEAADCLANCPFQKQQTHFSVLYHIHTKS